MQTILIVWFLRLGSVDQSPKAADFVVGFDARVERLYEATSKLPDVEPALVLPAVAAAIQAEHEPWTAELLIAIAWGESRLDGAVRTGRVCGIMQTMPARGDCALWARDQAAGFSAGVRELEEWARDRRTHGDVRLVLLAHACGNSAFDGTCAKTRWPGWVLRRARALGYKAVSPSS